MKRKIIDKLVAQSYKQNDLDEKKVNKIAALLSKSDLKRYINGLKLQDMKKSLIVSTPINNQDLKKFQKLFPNKKIAFTKDPSLMLGIRIVDNDMVYEFTLKNTLHKIISYMQENYD